MYLCSLGRTSRHESSTVHSRRNPISKPMRRHSGKLQLSVSKATLKTFQSAVDHHSGSAASVVAKTGHGTEGSKGRKLDTGLSQLSVDGVLAHSTDMFHSPLAERVKLRRMSQPGDVSSDDGVDADVSSKSTRLVATKTGPVGKTILTKAVAGARKKSNNSSKSSQEVYARKRPETVKVATTKKNSAVCSAVKSSKSKSNLAPKSTSLNKQRSIHKQQAAGSVKARCGSADKNKNLKQTSKVAATAQKLKMTVSKVGSADALRLKEEPAAISTAMSPKRSCKSVKEPVSTDVAEKMPRLKANNKQNDTTVRERKSMPVLQQETSVEESKQSAKKSPRKRQQQSAMTEVNSKVPKLSLVEETSHVAKKKGSLQKKAAAAAALSSDNEMPQLLAVELMKNAEPLRVEVDQFESPPQLDQSPSCAVKEPVSPEQKKPVPQSPVRGLYNNDVVVATSPRCVETVAERAENAPEKSAPKHSPARPKHRASQKPVSNRTALSQNNCSVSSSLAVAQTERSMSADCHDSQQMVAITTRSSCSASLPFTTPLKQTDFSVGSVTESQTEHMSTTESGCEIVPYTCPTGNAGGQWQVPCGVPMAPFIITGMYPMMGSGCRYPLMSFPPLVAPAMPTATSVISARGCSMPTSPLQYPLSAAAPVVPLYMSPVVRPFMQPASATSQVNLMPFVTSLPHAATAVHNQQGSATLLLRPSMSLPEHLYAVNCMLPAQQQVNLSLSGRRSAAVCVLVSSLRLYELHV